MRFSRLPLALGAALCVATPGAALLAPAPARADEPALGLIASLEQSFAQAAAVAGPSVVAVEVDREAERARRGVPAYAVRPGTPASGVLLEGGFVLTSYYHINGAASVRVRFSGEDEAVPASVLGRDEEVDLALLKVESVPDGVAPISRLRAEAPSVGSFVVAVGQGPHGATINTGIVSALQRFRGAVLQTDAAINYTNLGGAIVDLDGSLVGMAIRLSGRAGVNSGVGFVVPSGRIQASLALMKKGEVVPASPKPFLGVQFGKEHLDPPGLELARVVEDTAAARAGLREGDILTEFDGRALSDWASLSNAIAGKLPGDVVSVKGRREGADFALELTLGERPAGEE